MSANEDFSIHRATVRLSRMQTLSICRNNPEKHVAEVTIMEADHEAAAKYFRRLGPFFEEMRGKPTFKQLKETPDAARFMEGEENRFHFVLYSRLENRENTRREVRIYYQDADVPCAISRWMEGEGVAFITVH